MLFYNASIYGELNFAVVAKSNHSSTSRNITIPFIEVGNSYVTFTICASAK